MSDLPPPLVSQQTLLPADICIEALIVAGGNTHLAAERLFGSNNPHATAWLTASIAQDPLAQETLNAQLRTLTTLNAFDALNAAKVLLDSFMTDMDPDAFGKFYATLLQQMAAFTAPTPSQRQPDASQLAELLMSKMPPHVRRGFLELLEAPPTDDASAAPRPTIVNPMDDLDDERAG